MKPKHTIVLTVVLIGGFVLYLFSSEVFGRTPTATATMKGSEKVQAGQPIKNQIPGIAESSYLEKTVTSSGDGLKVVTNSADLLVLVNKERNLPADYKPSDLVYLTIPFPFQGDSPIRYLRQEAAEAIRDLFADAREDGINLVGKSGYRSYSIQKNLFTQYVASQGELNANKFSARPGQSEHQTGLAIDVTTVEMGYALKQSFGETTAGQWVAENCYKYGFIIRYPEAKEHVTGYNYEPWHLRYVGIEPAKEIIKKNLTLEEYLSLK